jgi:hypothetical protein
MMLASTVQFLRYGRNPSRITSWRFGCGPDEETSLAAVPSGLNSVLGLSGSKELAFHIAVF